MNTTITLDSYTQAVDLVKRKLIDNQSQQLEMTMLNSGIVEKESAPKGSRMWRRLFELPVKQSYGDLGSEGAPAKQAKFVTGYEKEIKIEKRDKAISITKEQRLGGDPAMMNKLIDLSGMLQRKIDLDLSLRLTFANVTSYVDPTNATVDCTGGDGKALCATDHPLTGSPITWSNVVPTSPVFSKGGLIAGMKVGVENTMNNLGEKMGLDYDIIITTDDYTTVVAVKELLNATADVTSSNAGTYNALSKSATGMKHIINKRIAMTPNGGVDTTKSKYWFIASSNQPVISYVELQAPMIAVPQDGNNGEDFLTGNWNFKTDAFYGIGFVSGRGIIGSFPSSN